MALFGLFGNTSSMASTTYSGRESASARKARKDAEAAARRAAAHRRSGRKALRAAQAADDAQRRGEYLRGKDWNR